MANIVNINDLQSIQNALNKSSFFYVPIPDNLKQLLNVLTTHCEQLFSASNETKQSYIKGKDGLGYTSLDKSRIDKTKPDIREAFNYRIGEIETNELYDKAINQLSSYAAHIFSKILESVDINSNDYLTKGTNTLSLIHYPNTNNQYGISEHTDWGFLTLLSTNEGGLQVKINNFWVDVPPLDNHFIVNIADMLEIISNGQYKSTEHRVIITEEKHSIVLFFQPDYNFIVKPHINSDIYKPIKFGDYIKQKIKNYHN